MSTHQYIRPLFIFIIKIVITLFLLYWVQTLVDLNHLIELFFTARYEFIVVGFLLVPLNVGLRIYRWKILVSSLGISIDWKTATNSLLVGIALGSFTPGEIGDYLGRMLHLPKARKSQIVGLTVLDRLQTMLAMALFAIPTLAFLFFNDHWILIGSLSLLSILSLYFLLGNQFSFLVHRFQNIRYVGSMSATLFKLKKRQQVISFCLIIFLILVIGIQMHCFLNAFVSIPFYVSVLGCSAMLFIKSFVPISIGDLGIRELTTVYIFSLWTVPMSASINASLLLFTANVFSPACCGVLVLFLTNHTNISTLFRND
ncbi:MAG: flippase-like domain-containing protein [Bacteroidetes bacterium]|nr:flippase-like domain-containing protein [Bacteroidota bacterium]